MAEGWDQAHRGLITVAETGQLGGPKALLVGFKPVTGLPFF